MLFRINLKKKLKADLLFSTTNQRRLTMNHILNSKIALRTLGAIGLSAFAVLPLQAASKIESEPNGSWVSLSGKVVSHTPKAFILDYGEGTITVETDDWDSIGDGWGINENDSVTVYGKVDNNFYKRKTIEAGSVYVDDLNTMITAPSKADEESPVPLTYTYLSVPSNYELQLSGTVTSVMGREFTIDTGTKKVSVDTINMSYNPLDNVGFQQVDEGDFVTVSGDLDLGIFDENEISAETIISYN